MIIRRSLLKFVLTALAIGFVLTGVGCVDKSQTQTASAPSKPPAHDAPPRQPVN